jgi:hypothetical protein
VLLVIATALTSASGEKPSDLMKASQGESSGSRTMNPKASRT